MNVSIVVGMVWIMFGILGISFMGDKLGYCLKPGLKNYYGINKATCITEEFGGTWTRAYWNFDNILESFVTLFIMSSLEGWPNIMASTLDAGDETVGPTYNGNLIGSLYYIVFILIGSLFLMNLFVGVIFFQFSQEQEKEKGSKFSMVSDEQMKWIMIQDLVSKEKVNFDLLQEPK